MSKEQELEKKGKLHDEELEVLADEVINIKRDYRTEIDNLRLEIETLKLFLSQAYPDFQKRFNTLKEKARLEICPE
jgi:hypothetical protein